MRYIEYNNNLISYPLNWGKNAFVANLAAKICNITDRSDEINKYSVVWSSLKPELKARFHDKCWYTESIISGTDGAVDHFRPKNKVINTKHTIYGKHRGYWWFAFEPNNYRFSCTYANSRRKDSKTDITGGKGDSFPLYTESKRAWLPIQNIEYEDNLLIDPCVKTDVLLITFKSDGEAMPRYSEFKNKFLFERAKHSILLYNINHSDFVKARLKVKVKLDEYLEAAKLNYDHLELGYLAERGYSLAISNLKQACSIESEYSRFSIDYISQFKHDDFLENLFL